MSESILHKRWQASEVFGRPAVCRLWDAVGASAAVQWLWHLAVDEGQDHVCAILDEAFPRADDDED